MWSSWCLLGWLLLATKRYMSRVWFWSHLLHSFIGTYVTFATLLYVWKMLQKNKGSNNLHKYLGLLVTLLVVLTWLAAILSVISAKFSICFMRWKYHKELSVRLLNLHKSLAKINLLTAYITITTGLVAY